MIKENQDASGGFGFPGMSLPDYRQGDTVQPGSTIAEVVDLTEMESEDKDPGDRARVGELGRPGESAGRGDARRRR